MQGLISQNSNMLSDLVLIFQWVIFTVLLIDWYIARKRDIKNHKRIILTLFSIQTVFNLYMLFRATGIQLQGIVLIHSVIGFFAYLLILYTVLYMTKKLPESLRFVPKERRTLLMQLTTVFWLFFTISGSLVYLTLYQ